MSAEKAKAVSPDFYDFIQRYNSKFDKGEKIAQEDVKAISEAFRSLSPSNAASSKQVQGAIGSPEKLKNFSFALQRFGANLRKEEFEQACKAVPYDYKAIKSAVDGLTHYIDELEKKSKSVTRKDTDTMPRHK